MTTTTTEVVAYARVSTDQQAERNTIEVQLQAIRDHCARQGYNVTVEYRDDGVSGATPFGDRPEGARLLASGARHVVIYCPDRLGRDLYEALGTLKELQRRRTPTVGSPPEADHQRSRGVLLSAAMIYSARRRRRPVPHPNATAGY